MNFKVNIKYMEGYLPTPRCRKLRFKECSEEVSTEIKEVLEKDAPMAFDCEGYKYRVYDNKLFALSNNIICISDNNKHLKGDIIGQLKDVFENSSIFYGFGENDTRDNVLKELKIYSDNYIIINGEVWTVKGEPRYVVNVFGLGNNHGSTSLSIVTYYNSNLSNRAYFNAFDRDKAIEKALSIAIGRGDTESLEFIKDCPEIKIFSPEMVKCNPLLDHCS